MNISKMEPDGEPFREEEGYKPPGEKSGSAQEGIMYVFYRKPMATPFGILSRSAMNQNNKVSTASSELKRRWKNTTCYVSKRVFEKITKEYMVMLSASGYSEEWRENMLLGAIKGYTKDV